MQKSFTFSSNSSSRARCKSISCVMYFSWYEWLLECQCKMDIEFVFRIGKPIHHDNYKIIETISMNCAAYTVIPRIQVRHA
jgi:hypothetical protein